MSIRKRTSKKIISGYTYQVYFSFVDNMGVHRDYFKGGFVTKKDAQTHEIIKRKELMDYGDVLANRDITFNEAFEEYMELKGKPEYAKATTQYYLSSHRLYIINTIGKSKLRMLKYRDIQKFFNELDVGISTAKNVKKIFDVTFRHGMESDYIRETPMHYVKLHNRPDKKKEVITITKEKLDEILEKMIIVDKHAPDKDYTQFNYYAYAVAIFIGWYTGLRVSETLGLKKRNFDFENNVIHIEQRLQYHGIKKSDLHDTEKLKTKNSKATIPLASKLKEGLLIWFEKNPYETVVCVIYGNSILPASLNHRIKKVAVAVGIPEFHYHCLRHSFATNLANNDVKPRVRMELVRHASVDTTENYYTHVSNENKTQALESVFGKDGM